MQLDSLPSQYLPFRDLEVGTNHLVNGRALFAINGHVPLLVGSGETLHVWLSIPADPKGTTWQLLVRDNRSLHPKVKVKISGQTIVVDTPDGVVLRAQKTGEDTARIDRLDLRPFGINIYGDEDTLTVMTGNLSRNTFANTNVMVGIGDSPKEGLTNA